MQSVTNDPAAEQTGLLVGSFKFIRRDSPFLWPKSTTAPVHAWRTGALRDAEPGVGVPTGLGVGVSVSPLPGCQRPSTADAQRQERSLEAAGEQCTAGPCEPGRASLTKVAWLSLVTARAAAVGMRLASFPVACLRKNRFTS